MTLLNTHQSNSKNKKLAVVAIAGPYRSGKSFLANRFLGRMKGFEIGSTVQSCTRGIWMWNRIIPLNDEVDAILLDTEGLGSTDREFETDIKIFSLSILLSSTFVYNQIGHINERSIEDMSVVLRLTNELKIRDTPTEETGLEFK
jgi:GTPase Era involved in 16S rRNA processing